MRYLLLLLFLVGCGPDHTQNVDITPTPTGGAPQNSFTQSHCVDGEKAVCEYSYKSEANGNVSIVYGYRICKSGCYSECMKY